MFRRLRGNEIPLPPFYLKKKLRKALDTFKFLSCDLCGQLQRCHMPDIENSRKTAEKGAEWVTVKQPKNSRENSRNTRKTVKTAVFRVFRLFSRLFFGCFTMTHSAPFSAVFRLFSMSGIWHLCSWPQRSQFLRHVMRAILPVRPKCSHRCVSPKETPLKPVQSLKHTTKNSAEQTVMRTKWFKHIAI